MISRNLQDALYIGPCPNLTGDLPPFSYADFELMHQWTAITASSIAPYEPYIGVMQDVVPLMAMQYPYLMLVERSFFNTLYR